MRYCIHSEYQKVQLLLMLQQAKKEATHSYVLVMENRQWRWIHLK